MSNLFEFQQRAKEEIFAAWRRGVRNVLIKSPTGSGKTVIAGSTIKTMDCPTVVIAHRSELISQCALALTRENIRHRIVGPDQLRRNCVSLQMDRYGYSLFDVNAKVAVCSVDTLRNRTESWFSNAQLWVLDEAHHLLRENKWGKVIELFPNARGLGFTATVARADRQGLGRQAAGAFDEIIVAAEMQDLIEQGFLTKFRIFAPPSDVNYSSVPVTPSGDLSPAKNRAAVHASNTIVGDVVKHYLRLAPGKLGVTFAVDVKAAEEIAAKFKVSGVPAEVISAKTPDLLRAKLLRDFSARRILQLVNVDLFGEGFDLPAIEVVSMVRKTESWPLYVQQFGRALRVMVEPELMKRWGNLSNEERLHHIVRSQKPHAIIIDHVGNVIRHGLPSTPREETLNSMRGKKNTGGEMPVRTCANPEVERTGLPCLHVYPRFLRTCPECDYYPEPAVRSDPAFVDGDLFELDLSTLTSLRNEIARIDGAPLVPQHLDMIAARGVINQHRKRIDSQQELRELIALWAGWQNQQGFDDSQGYRKFFHQFGIDVLTAQTLGANKADALSDQIQNYLTKNGVTVNE